MLGHNKNSQLLLCRDIMIIRRIKIMSRHNKNSEFLLCLDIILIQKYSNNFFKTIIF